MSDLPTNDPLPERARIDASPPPKRLDALPVLYLVGFVILASALIYMWRHPSMPRSAAQDAARVATMRQELDETRQESQALAARVAAIEARPAPAAPNLGPLDGRIAALEARPTQNGALMDARVQALEGRKPTDLGPLEARLAALDARKPVDLGPVEAKLAALEHKQAEDVAAAAAKLDAQGKQVALLGPRLDRLEVQAKQGTEGAAALKSQVDQVEAQARQAVAGLQSVSERAQRFQRVQAAGVALEAGARLGDIPGAPSALARFAHDAPPTEAGLRLSFNTAAEAAHRASQPAITDNQPFLDRMWTRAQQSVTVRQGDRVLVGDPIAGVISHARELLDAGDLAGAVHALDGLAGPAKAAMADWMARAQALLDARAAVAELAARG